MPTSLDLASVAEAGDALSARPEAEYVLESLLRVVMGRLLTTRGAVLLEQGDRVVVAATRGALDIAPGDEVPLDAPLGEELPTALRDAGLSLPVPMRHGGRVAGLLALGPRATGEPHAPTAVDYARSLAGVAAAALHAAREAEANARAHAALGIAGRDLAVRAQALEGLAEAARAFAAAPDRPAVLRALGYATMGQLPADRWTLVLADGTGSGTPAAARGLTAPLPPELRERLAFLARPLEGDDELAGSGLELAVPVAGAERSRGALAVGPRATGRPYGEPDRAFLGALGGLALAALDRVALVDARIEKERLEEEMRLARGIQERLLPRGVPSVEGLDLAVCARPNRVVAGDYHDFVALPGGSLVVAVADVAGKGAPAALLMANVQAAVRLLAPDLDGPDPSGVLAAATGRLNRVIAGNTAPGVFVTLAWAVWDGRRLVYCNAGHPPPRVARADGTVEALEAGGPLLGVINDAVYSAGAVTLDSGDVAVLYSDGLSEARRGDEEFGDRRLDEVLAEKRGGTALEILDGLCDEAADFGGGPPGDDLTVLVLKVTG
jgi:sigma-B regulation protein RsbU (phosphoserine phosphatase)